jgi:hypothetical protein
VDFVSKAIHIPNGQKLAKKLTSWHQLYGAADKKLAQ